MAASFFLPTRNDAKAFKSWANENINAISAKLGIVGTYTYKIYSLGCEVCVLYEGVCPHANAIYVDPTVESCESAGKKEHYICLDCERKYLDGELTSPVNESELYIAPLGHAYRSSCDSVCTRCGNERIAPHVLTKTEAESDTHTRSCACGASSSTAPHIDTNLNGLCDVCNNTMPKDSESIGAQLPDLAFDMDSKTLVITAVCILISAALLIAVLYRIINKR
jgi:hypothetical protein